MAQLIYIPEYSSGKCAYIYNSDIIRVYDSTPVHNSTINYTDYYIKSSYISNTGSTTFSNYSNLPVCISSDRITTDIEYRNDFPDICFMFLFYLIITLLPPYLLYKVFRKRV